MKFLGLNKNQGHSERNKKGVLLVNLGTPNKPSTVAVRQYLAEFLSDPRVIEIPRLIWLCILHGIILRIRPAKSAALYEKIWTNKGSPLMAISGEQQQKLQQLLDTKNANVKVYLAMRYGDPSIASVMNCMQKEGVDNMVILPLYPQYAAPTTGSVFDAVAKVFMSWRYIPSLHFIHTYHDNEYYIQALADTVNNDYKQYGKPQKLLMSFHGMPQRNLELGDPYYCFCVKTARLLAEKLRLNKDDYEVTFQSRFGKAKWLSPYTNETLAAYPKQNITDIAVICPAFSADCLETLEEISQENREIFLNAGGSQFRYIPALNTDDKHIEMMEKLISPYL